jgi:hypothetical protein
MKSSFHSTELEFDWKVVAAALVELFETPAKLLMVSELSFAGEEES